MTVQKAGARNERQSEATPITTQAFGQTEILACNKQEGTDMPTHVLHAIAHARNHAHAHADNDIGNRDTAACALLVGKPGTELMCVGSDRLWRWVAVM